MISRLISILFLSSAAHYVMSGTITTLCEHTTNGGVIHSYKKEFTRNNFGVLLPARVPELGGALQKNHQCKWTITADKDHEIHYYLFQQLKTASKNCPDFLEKTEIFNKADGNSNHYCGYACVMSLVPSSNAEITVNIGNDDHGRDFIVYLYQDKPSKRKRSADQADVPVAGGRRQPKQLSEYEIKEVITYVANTQNKMKFCSDCDRRPFVEEYCACQNVPDPCVVEPTATINVSPTNSTINAQESEADIIAEEPSSRRRRRHAALLKSSHRVMD